MAGFKEERLANKTRCDKKTPRLLKRRREFCSNGANFVPTAQVSFQQREFRFNIASFVSTKRVLFQQRRFRFNNASFVPTL
jgi:hypothetical protein